jgi:hypothetical protein
VLATACPPAAGMQSRVLTGRVRVLVHAVVCRQMEDFAALFSPEVVAAAILPMVPNRTPSHRRRVASDPITYCVVSCPSLLLAARRMRQTVSLCRDTVAAVRTVGIKGVGAVLTRLHAGNRKAFGDAVNGVLAFASSRNYTERQLFIRMSQHMLHTGSFAPELYEHEFMDALSKLAGDRVPNVRLTLSQLGAQLANHRTCPSPVHHLTVFSPDPCFAVRFPCACAQRILQRRSASVRCWAA